MTPPQSPEVPGRAPRLRALLGIVFVLAAVVAVVMAAGSGDVLSRLAAADPAWMAAALGLVQFQIIASAVRWQYTAGRLGLRIATGRAIGEYYLASLLNMVLPGGVAGDILRAARGSLDQPAERRAVVRAVILERLAGQAAFWLVAVAGFLLLITGRDLPAPEGAAILLVTVPAVALIAVGGVWIAGRFGPARIRGALAGLGPDVARAWGGGMVPLVQGGLSLAIAASYIGVFAMAGAAIGAPLPLAGILSLIPLALISMLVPVSIGGWGVREGTAALLWPLAGLTAADGVATSALYGALAMVGALPGLLVLLPARPHGSSRA